MYLVALFSAVNVHVFHEQINDDDDDVYDHRNAKSKMKCLVLLPMIYNIPYSTVVTLMCVIFFASLYNVAEINITERI